MGEEEHLSKYIFLSNKSVKKEKYLSINQNRESQRKPYGRGRT